MLEKIRQLEQAGRVLDPDRTDRASLRGELLTYTEDFLDRTESDPTYRLHTSKGMGLYDAPIRETGMGMDSVLELFRKEVELPGLNPASGGHLGYIPGGGLYLSALGDYLADVTNRYAGVFFGNPGAVRMENILVRWMADLVGYGEGAAGTLLSGGSLANLTCIVAARDAKGIRPRYVEESVVYLTGQVHHCVTKALRIAGLGEAIVREVPLDARYRMDVRALEAQVEKDKAAGLRPFLVVASAGTTDTGAVDPVDQIAPVAQAHDLWLHVDAAYGGFFILCEDGRQRLPGLELSDSIVMDPHKGLFLPYGTGAAIVKDGQALATSHEYTANYLQDAERHADEVSPADVSPELTRHFRGLRMWLPLQVHGLAPFRACVEEKLWLARYFWEQLAEIPHMERGPEPDLSVVLYRYVPPTGDANAFNQALIQRCHDDGRVFISSTSIGGKVYLRLACLSFRTHLETIHKCLDMLKEHIEVLHTHSPD